MLKGKIRHKTVCRFCKSTSLILVVDLGFQPLAGEFLDKERIGKEDFYPLRLYECQKCGLVQMMDIVPREKLFQSFLTSSSQSLIVHFENFAEEMMDRFLPDGGFVVEIGSNDGTLLKFFKDQGINVLGIEPVEKIAEIAKKKGLDVITDYFGLLVARKIGKRADLVVANNVFAHIDDMKNVMAGIKHILKDNGLFVFEVHTLTDMLDNNRYENIYHEHLSYYTVSALANFLKKWDFEIIEVKRIDTHFGSMRVYAKKYNKDKFVKYQKGIEDNKRKLVQTLTDLKNKGKKVIGYGASGKANTLLNYCGITSDLLEYIIDESPLRYGKYTPGSHIPVISLDKADLTKVDVVLILAWNYKKEIKDKLKDYKLEFILPK